MTLIVLALAAVVYAITAGLLFGAWERYKNYEADDERLEQVFWLPVVLLLMLMIDARDVGRWIVGALERENKPRGKHERRK